MATDSHYNGSIRDNKSLNNEEAIRLQFQTSLIDAFITKQEEYDQFKQNDEKQYEEDDDWRIHLPTHSSFRNFWQSVLSRKFMEQEFITTG